MSSWCEVIFGGIGMARTHKKIDREGKREGSL
jgi:hypothetical protein